MYQIDWNIVFRNPSTGKKFQLMLLNSVEITSDVENLCDTATIVLPEAILNRVLEIESKISRGTEVEISMGYDGALKSEFIGFIKEIRNADSSLHIECEDSIFVFRKQVANAILKPTTVSGIAQTIIDQIDPTFKLVCDYDIGYEKFVINQATGFDVLQKLQEEIKANIYFDNAKKELHIHAPFLQKSGEVKYSPFQNVQSVSLEYKKAVDRKYEITVESIGLDGKVKQIKKGTTGGETVTIKCASMSEADMEKIADAELSKRSADRYEGSIDTWLIPMIKPTATAIYDDPDYPDKKGSYYVPAVKVSLSESGAVRNVSIGIKL